MREPILAIQNISKTFPGVKALDNVNLELFSSEVHALVGENGAGKSTLMKIISGIHAYDEGHMTYEGQIYKPESPHFATESGIIIIHQELNLIEDMSIQENIFLGNETKGNTKIFLDDHDMKNKTKNLMEQVGLSKSPNVNICDLSVGEQQMVEIAKALSKNAKVLIFDEPTAALTDSEVDKLFEVINKLRVEGVAMVYISHKMEEIFKISDRVTVLRDGKTISTTFSEKTNVDKIISEMVGRELSEVFPERTYKPNENVVLEVNNLFDLEDTINDISFKLNEGEILGVAGLMGSGRSELTKTLFGARKVKSGEIILKDKCVSFKTPLDAISKGIHLVSEDRKNEGLILENTVTENIMLPNLSMITSIRGLSTSKGEAISKEIIKKLEVKTPSGQEIVNNLSGGNQQKIFIGKWLVAKPEILILDEPTRGVDVGAKAEIYEIINNLSKNGISIIMVSSELPEVLGLTDRVLVLNEGKISGEFITKDTNQDELMYAATGEYHENK